MKTFQGARLTPRGRRASRAADRVAPWLAAALLLVLLLWHPAGW